MQLSKSHNVVTQNPMVNCVITYDSQHAVTVTKRSDREYFVKMYSLETYKQVFEEVFGGKPDSYIKMKNIQ